MAYNCSESYTTTENDMVFDVDDCGMDKEDEILIRNSILYHRIVSVNTDNDQWASFTLDNGTILETFGNEGCGGCGNGWFYIDELNNVDNIITDVSIESSGDGEYGDETYSIFVYADNTKINLISYSGSDNGYYGVGFRLRVREKI